jgi:putative tryptophan/tyrosine transport system substrate-binding protein
MTACIRRREFITLLGGAAARRRGGRVAVGGARAAAGNAGGRFLSSGQPQVFAHMIDAFRQGLNETGYAVGQNVAFEHRAAGSEYDRFRAMADDLVRRRVAVIFATGGTAAALAARTATSTIPIVFYMGGDPVQQGLVASLSRPGGNITGFGWLGFALAAKRLELLRELLPNGKTIGMLVNPANPDSDFEMRDVQDAARTLGRQIHILTASSDGDFDGVFATLVKEQIGALIVAAFIIHCTSCDAYNSTRGS